MINEKIHKIELFCSISIEENPFIKYNFKQIYTTEELIILRPILNINLKKIKDINFIQLIHNPSNNINKYGNGISIRLYKSIIEITDTERSIKYRFAKECLEINRALFNKIKYNVLNSVHIHFTYIKFHSDYFDPHISKRSQNTSVYKLTDLVL